MAGYRKPDLVGEQMKKLNMTFIFIIILMIFPIIAVAKPFEMFGYEQGLSLEQIREHANKEGHTLIPRGETGFYIYKDKTLLLDIGLCKGKLFLMKHNVSGGMDLFFNQLNEYKSRLGYKQLDADWVSWNDGAEHYTIRFFFVSPEKNKTHYVQLSLNSDSKNGVTGYQIFYLAYNNECLKFRAWK